MTSQLMRNANTRRDKAKKSQTTTSITRLYDVSLSKQTTVTITTTGRRYKFSRVVFFNLLRFNSPPFHPSIDACRPLLPRYAQWRRVRFGVCQAEICRDHVTGDSLNYAFVEFDAVESCEEVRGNSYYFRFVRGIGFCKIYIVCIYVYTWVSNKGGVCYVGGWFFPLCDDGDGE